MATDILPEPRDQLGTTTHFSSVAIIRVIPDAIDWGKRVYHKMRSTVFLFSSINTHFQPRAAAQSTAIAIAPITPNSPTTPEMFPFIPFQAFVPPVIMVPVREQWTSTLDIRKSRESRTGKRMALGNGACHHDFISFSFADDKNPPDETLVVMHPVTTRHYIDLQTEKLKALFEVLADLQETRAWAMGLGIEEMPARQRTIDVLADVLRARDDGLGLGGGKKEGNGEGEPEE